MVITPIIAYEETESAETLAETSEEASEMAPEANEEETSDVFENEETNEETVASIAAEDNVEEETALSAETSSETAESADEEGSDENTMSTAEGEESEESEESFNESDTAVSAARDETSLTTAAEETSSSNSSNYITGFYVKETIDGTSPFDDDDEAGNDSSESNGIVRSFDDIEYTIEYTTGAFETAETCIVYIEFTLAGDPSKWRWDTSQFNYLDNISIILTREDGTEEEIMDYESEFDYDEYNLVVSQTISATYEIVPSGGAEVGTFAAGICVKAAANNDTIAPSFIAWLDGNSEEEYATATADTITVSATPKYDIHLARNSYLYYVGYFNLTDGTFARSQQSEDDVFGEILGYGITVRLYNDSSAKGFKGIELPTGDITFDVTLTETLDGEDITDEDGYGPVLWDYRENQSGTSSTVGYLGRKMYFNSNSTVYSRGTVGNESSSRSWKYCYDGGTWTITQDSNDSNVYHVTISDYTFDFEQFHFPTGAIDYTTGQTLSGYGTYIGAFSAGYVQCLYQVDKEQTAEDAVLTGEISVNNLTATSVSGEVITTTDEDGTSQEMLTSNNTSSVTLNLYTSGTVSKQSWWGNSSGGTKLGTITNSYADGAAYAGETVTVWSGVQLSLNFSLQSLNILQKIDADYVTIPAGTTKYTAYSLANSTESTYGTVTTLFAAKTDGTNWVDQTEMNTTDEEELIYFEAIDDLTAAGYVCVWGFYMRSAMRKSTEQTTGQTLAYE